MGCGCCTSECPVKLRIETTNSIKVLAVRKTGSYVKSGEEAWKELMSVVQPSGIMGPDTKMIGIGYDDPRITPEEELRYDACVSVGEEVEAIGDTKILTIPGGNYAVFLHEGPYEELMKTYGFIYEKWAKDTDEKMKKQEIPCFELYLNCPDKVEPKDLKTEIWIPIE